MNKNKLRRILLVMFMAITLPFSIEHTYSYWTDNISKPINQTVETTISIGSWGDIYEEWKSYISYSTSDVVTYGGRYYRAIRSSTGVPPRGVWYWWFFWTEITI